MRAWIVTSGSVAALFVVAACANSSRPDLTIATPFVDRGVAPIPDDSSILIRQLSVRRAGAIFFATVEVILQHQRPEDLTVTLVSPRGTRLPLKKRGSKKAKLSRYRRQLTALRGEPASGIWRLEIVDDAPGMTGGLVAWGLEFEAPQGGPRLR